MRSIKAPYRGKWDIYADMIGACNNGGKNKTNIMYKAGLNFKQLKRYLKETLKKRLLKRSKNNENIFEHGEKASVFMEEYRGLSSLLTV